MTMALKKVSKPGIKGLSHKLGTYEITPWKTFTIESAFQHVENNSGHWYKDVSSSALLEATWSNIFYIVNDN